MKIFKTKYYYKIFFTILLLQGCASGNVSESKFAYNMKKDIIITFPMWISKEAKTDALNKKGQIKARDKCGLNKPYKLVNIVSREWLEEGFTINTADAIKQTNSIGADILCIQKTLENKKTKNEGCFNNPRMCNNRELCNKATINKNNKIVWDTNPVYSNYLSEAKRKNLSCKIEKVSPKNNIDKLMKYALSRLVKLNLLSNKEMKKKEKVLEKMNSQNFNSFYMLCKNAFANSEPSKCDQAIKDLN